MATHTIYISPTPVLNNIVIDKNTATIAEVLQADTEMRIVPNSNVPNSMGHPTIEEYVNLESNDGFSVVSLTNTMIITES